MTLKILLHTYTNTFSKNIHEIKTFPPKCTPPPRASPRPVLGGRIVHVAEDWRNPGVYAAQVKIVELLGNTWTILYVSIKFWPVLATKRLLLNGIFVIWALLDPLWACFAILRTFWAQVQNITGYPQRPKLPKYPFVPKSSQTWKNSKMKFSCDTLYVVNCPTRQSLLLSIGSLHDTQITRKSSTAMCYPICYFC